MLRPLILVGCLLAGPAFSETTLLTIAKDRYEVGESLRFDGPAVTDLFMAGNRVVVAAVVDGSVHLAGRRVSVEGPVAGDLFAVGYGVEVSGAVGGDASITGYEIRTGSITGNLRAAGSDVEVGAVGGYALITGANVVLQGAIAGDAVLVADDIRLGPEASVAGVLTIYAEDPTTITIPESVAPAARVKIETRRSYDKGDWEDRMPMQVPLWRIATGFLTGVLISGLIAALVLVIAPKAVQGWRALALAHPGRAIWSGFLVTSALAGSGFVLMLTIVGVFLLPVMLIITAVAIFAGYALGSYVLGVGLWLQGGKSMPEGLAGKFGLACLGAFVAGLAWLVPVAGWFFVLGLTLLGIGTLAAFILPDGLLLRRAAAAS
jgi:cytoskeletal protein CcmA (bactofilin family)